jgi:hypothetical protein
MIKNLAYVTMGFAATYISLEVAWHFAACRFKDDNKIKPYMFKEIKIAFMAPSQASPGRVR